ncbi:MAG: hypothetical protein ABS79_00465 [Planctomycetes bacterium SCN 63-9]|nr:MAG: hypothetical protein ABS79_00465 [Planctomycetes bacterium SCN 63-9]
MPDYYMLELSFRAISDRAATGVMEKTANHVTRRLMMSRHGSELYARCFVRLGALPAQGRRVYAPVRELLGVTDSGDSELFSLADWGVKDAG